jgi:nucleotide-binding universal stress UspA family protein
MSARRTVLPALAFAAGYLLVEAGEVLIEETSKGLDLLVVGSSAYGPLRRVLLGSTSIEVVRGAACPVRVRPRIVS